MILRTWHKVLLAVGFAIVGVALWLYLLLSMVISSGRTAPENMVPTTLAWGRLAPFPKLAKNFEITSEGSMFTRGFRASFTASAADVQRWLQASPGTRDVTPKPESAKAMRYVIDPGGGAAYAEVTVEGGTLVRVYVYWS